MTRSELMALAERLSAARVYGRDIEQAADFMRQIAESKPVAWAATDESGTVVEALGMNQSRRFDTALYTLPLED